MRAIAHTPIIRGFSLIEVLITLVVLSIGLLSLAALQLATLKNNNSALTRSEATILAYDVLDRMRANRTQAVQGDYDIGLTETVAAGSGIASQDLAAWKSRLASELPGGRGSVSVSARRALVTVQWSENWDANLAEEPDDRVVSLVFGTEL